MTAQLVIGVDPGLTTGIFSMTYRGDGSVAEKLIAVQVHGHAAVVDLVQTLLSADLAAEPLLAVEAFVVGNRAARSSSAFAGKITRNLIGALSDMPTRRVSYPAATVKPWATDKRLEAAGLHPATAGMAHSRDAARHALYAAVQAGITRDPLSKFAGAR